MIDVARLFAEICLAWLTITLAASMLSAIAYPLFSRIMQPHCPDKRAGCILVYGLLAPAAATLVVVLLMLPELSNALLPQHCHGTICGPHTPAIASTSLLGTALVSIATLVVIGLVAIAYHRLQHYRRRLLTLDALSDPISTYRVVDSPDPLAWCGGLWRPQVYLSQGLISQLSPRQLQVVLAHEHAHATHRDNLRKTLLHWVTTCWPGPLKTKIRHDFTAASEQACDLAAVRLVEDTAVVESVIALLSQHTDKDRSSRQSAFAAGTGACRLRHKYPPSGHYLWLLIAFLWTTEVVLLARAAHPILEWITAPGVL